MHADMSAGIPGSCADHHSQLGADRFVLSLFEGSSQQGFFVDVGAADGFEISNSLRLEQHGWSGIAIDPLLRNFEARRCIALKCAVYGQKDQEVQFAVCGSDPNLSGVAHDLGCYRDLVTSGGTLLCLRSHLLADILDHYNVPKFIEFLSLDTEGSEYKILETFPFERYTFGVISVEHNFEQPKRSHIQNLLERAGYVLALQVQWDDWYVHQSLAPKLTHFKAT